MISKKKTLIYMLIFVLLIVVTVAVIVSNSSTLTKKGLIESVKHADPLWLSFAFIAMLGIVTFEALAVITLSRCFGFKPGLGKGLKYAAGDVYFSAITPSATGGQPASAFFMMKDGINGAATTIILLINLTLYSIALILIGVICFPMRPEMLGGFSPLSKIMIAIGFGFQFVMCTVFVMLVYKEKIIMKFANFCLRLLRKLHLMKNIEPKQKRLLEMEHEYKQCAGMIKDNKKRVFVALIFNLCQRICQVLVTVFVFVACYGQKEKMADVFAMQGYVTLGANSVPIPGSVGAADFLFMDGFRQLIKDPSSLELVSRGISFYAIVLICGIATLIFSLRLSLKGRKK